MLKDDIAAKSKVNKSLQMRYNVKSVVSQNQATYVSLTDSHRNLFFQQDAQSFALIRK